MELIGDLESMDLSGNEKEYNESKISVDDTTNCVDHKQQSIDGITNRIDDKDSSILVVIKQDIYFYLRENCKRWCTCLGCVTRFYTPTCGEEEMMSSKLSEWNKKYLVHRKSRLTYVFLFNTLANVTLLVNNVAMLKQTTTSPNDDSTEAIISAYAYYYGTRVNLGFAVLKIIVCILLLFARLIWYRYKQSSRLVMSALSLELMLPMIIYFVPYRNIFLSDNSELSIGVQSAIFFYILYLSKNFFYALALLPQSTISNASSLCYVYPNSPEFKIAVVAVNIIYVPIIVVIFGLLFQIASGAKALINENVNTPYDWRVFGLMIAYLGTLLIPMITFSQYNVKKRFLGLVLYYCSLVIIVVLGMIVLIPFIPSDELVSIYFSGYSASLLNEVTVSDALICAVASFSKNDTDDKAPHNLYNEKDNTTISTVLYMLMKRGYDGLLYFISESCKNIKKKKNDNNNDDDNDNLKDTENPIAKTHV